MGGVAVCIAGAGAGVLAVIAIVASVATVAAGRIAGDGRRQAAEWRGGALQFRQFGFARHRQLRDGGRGSDVARIDAGQNFRVARRMRLRMADLRRDRGDDRSRARGRVAGFQRVVIFSHWTRHVLQCF